MTTYEERSRSANRISYACQSIGYAIAQQDLIHAVRKATSLSAEDQKKILDQIERKYRSRYSNV